MSIIVDTLAEIIESADESTREEWEQAIAQVFGGPAVSDSVSHDRPPLVPVDNDTLGGLIEAADNWCNELNNYIIDDSKTEPDAAQQYRSRLAVYEHAIDTARRLCANETNISTSPIVDLGRCVRLDRVTLVYRDEDGKRHEQPLPDITSVGTLIDPETGEDLELVEAVLDRDEGGVRIDRAQLDQWAGRSLSPDEVERLSVAIQYSSVPDAIGEIVAGMDPTAHLKGTP